MSDSTLLFCSQDPDFKLQIGSLLKLMAQTSRRNHSSLGDILKQLTLLSNPVSIKNRDRLGSSETSSWKFNQCWRQSAETNYWNTKINMKILQWTTTFCVESIVFILLQYIPKLDSNCWHLRPILCPVILIAHCDCDEWPDTRLRGHRMSLQRCQEIQSRANSDPRPSVYGGRRLTVRSDRASVRSVKALP